MPEHQRGTRWTDKDDARLIEMYKSLSVAKIALALDRTEAIVHNRINNLKFDGRIVDRVLPKAVRSALVHPTGGPPNSAARAQSCGPSTHIGPPVPTLNGAFHLTSLRAR